MSCVAGFRLPPQTSPILVEQLNDEQGLILKE